jgi:hypothetical protein
VIFVERLSFWGNMLNIFGFRLGWSCLVSMALQQLIQTTDALDLSNDITTTVGNDVTNTSILAGNSSVSPSRPQPYSSQTVRTIQGLVLLVICVFATFGNLSLWIIITRTKALRNASNYLLLCLSLADILVSVINMPITAHTILKV